VLTLLFDGIAYGMLLFVLSLGLAVTMGLMNFINLAHGAFAMAGGYVLIVLMQRHDWPFLACLPVAFVVTALAGALLERTLYRPMYGKPHLDQVLFSIGLTFMAVATVDWLVGSSPQTVQLPDWLRLRAAVDDPRVAAGLGIPVNRVFLVTFAVGSGLAGLGGALGADILGLDPTFPLKFMVYFLIVVAVGGTSSITGPLVASLVLGIADVMGKYYVPKLGAFIVYVLMIAILLWRPQGLFSRQGAR
jgi:branched-chain amino acid transport system permease protein